MRLVIFDFDGTLTKKDSLGEFLRYYYKKNIYFKKLLRFLPFFILYKLKILKNDIAKEKLITIFFKDENEFTFKQKAREFALNKINSFLNKKVYNEFCKHKKNNDEVIIISASFKCWIDEWAKKEQVKSISTILEIKNHKLTGKFKTKNCYGIEKVNRLKKEVDISKYSEIISYGDSDGDRYIFEISNKFFKIPNTLI